VRTFRALLRGDTVEWDGHPIRMLHPDGHAPARPIELPVLISALGPKGLAITREIADGLFSVNNQTDHAHEFTWAALGIHGAGFAVSCGWVDQVHRRSPHHSPDPSGDPDLPGTGGHPGAPPGDVTATSSTNEARLRP
jgi:hypothetical protein